MSWVVEDNTLLCLQLENVDNILSYKCSLRLNKTNNNNIFVYRNDNSDCQLNKLLNI
jgi:hypothetical protein